MASKLSMKKSISSGVFFSDPSSLNLNWERNTSKRWSRAVYVVEGKNVNIMDYRNKTVDIFYNNLNYENEGGLLILY